MRDFLIGMGIVLAFLTVLLGGTFWAAYNIDEWSCSERWSDFDSEYTFGGGCRVSVSGRMIPEDRVREIQP